MPVAPARIRFALASCQVWVGGRYASYRTMAMEDLDLVVHVGDYIYEEDATESLADYRVLHAKYKTSPDLQLAHRQFPFVSTFDDHEVQNDWAAAYPSSGYDNNDQRRFAQIRRAAFQAYYEHLPLRLSARPDGQGMRAYRRLRFGELLELSVLDTRQYRSDPRLPDSAASMLGPVQEHWLLDGLARSPTTWNAIAQQTMMARFDYDIESGERLNKDQWDGFQIARDRLLRGIADRHVVNPVVLSGDWHSSWVNELKIDWMNPDSPTVATEFVGPSISSGCPWAADVTLALPSNPHVRFFDGEHRGWVRCTVTPSAWRSDYRSVASADDTAQPAETLTSWTVENRGPGVEPS
nr:alkaline phosphatase D family protein [Pseudonocardia hierapolitana]